MPSMVDDTIADQVLGLVNAIAYTAWVNDAYQMFETKFFTTRNYRYLVDYTVPFRLGI